MRSIFVFSSMSSFRTFVNLVFVEFVQKIPCSNDLESAQEHHFRLAFRVVNRSTEPRQKGEEPPS